MLLPMQSLLGSKGDEVIVRRRKVSSERLDRVSSKGMD